MGREGGRLRGELSITLQRALSSRPLRRAWKQEKVHERRGGRAQARQLMQRETGMLIFRARAEIGTLNPIRAHIEGKEGVDKGGERGDCKARSMGIGTREKGRAGVLGGWASGKHIEKGWK